MACLLTFTVPGKQLAQDVRYAANALHRMHAQAGGDSITRIEEPATTTAFKTKMATAEAQQIYSQRSQIAEFPHAWIKESCGLRQFRCRGRLKVTMEATWACLSYNLARWFRIRRRFNMELAHI